jgi:hypothetical protein
MRNAPPSWTGCCKNTAANGCANQRSRLREIPMVLKVSYNQNAGVVAQMRSCERSRKR